MELIYELLKQLFGISTPVGFALISVVILLVSSIISVYVVNNVNRGGFFSILFKGNKQIHLELSEIKKIASDVGTETKHISEIKNELIPNQLKILQDLRKSIIDDLDDVREILRAHNQWAQKANENNRDMLQRLSDNLSKMNIEWEKMNEFLRNAIPELKMNDRDIEKMINDLGKDINQIRVEAQAQKVPTGIQLK
jgi:uncharacterized protein YukE